MTDLCAVSGIISVSTFCGSTEELNPGNTVPLVRPIHESVHRTLAYVRKKRHRRKCLFLVVLM